ncbi:MAG: response regulator [Methanoregula sp.]
MISVLLIDDDPELLEIISLEIGRDGDFSIQMCDSPFAALELAQMQKFDSIVCDFSMPGMDGGSLLQFLRSHGCTAQLILYSGNELDEELKNSLTGCVDAYVQREGNPEAEFSKLKEIIRTASTAKQQHPF